MNLLHSIAYAIGKYFAKDEPEQPKVNSYYPCANDNDVFFIKCMIDMCQNHSQLLTLEGKLNGISKSNEYYLEIANYVEVKYATFIRKTASK